MKFQVCMALLPWSVMAAEKKVSDLENLRGSLVKNIFPEGAPSSVEIMHVQDPDVTEVVDWDDCTNSAPFIITNNILRTQGSRKYMYMYETTNSIDESWKFLHNFDYVDSWVADYVWVEEMNAAEALSRLNIEFANSGKTSIMFYVHGWNSGIEDAWCSGQHFREQTDFFAIPIIWRTDRGGGYSLDYRYDRVWTAPHAAVLLSNLFGPFFSQITVPKSWMCHSMGCYVTQIFATEVSEEEGFTTDTKFDHVFMVAPDVRYDVFNEWPLGSGPDKNDCEVGEWNDPRPTHVIPDCRLGGGDALVDMSSAPVAVHWNYNDAAGSARRARLGVADNIHPWPISAKGLLNHGDDPDIGRGVAERLKDFVIFTKHDEFGIDHSYQFYSQMMAIYNAALDL